MKRLVAAGWVALGLLAVHAAEPEDERARLREERAAIEARFRAEEAGCAGRFAVTACMDRARAGRREALAPVDRALAALEDAERRKRASERLQRIEAKQREAAERRPPPAKVVPSPRRPPAAASAAALPDDAAPGAGPANRQPALRPSPRPGAADAYDRRQREAAAHREAVERRNEERAARRPPAAPLPAPASAPH
jgi:hypothetical protein